MDLETFILSKLDAKTTYLLFDQSRHKFIMMVRFFCYHPFWLERASSAVPQDG